MVGKMHKRQIRKRSIYNSAGITLVELLISVAMISIIAIPFANIFIASIHNNHETEKRMQAYAYANQEMEELKNSNIDLSVPHNKMRGDYLITSEITLVDKPPMPDRTSQGLPTLVFEIADNLDRQYIFREDGFIDELIEGCLQFIEYTQAHDNLLLKVDLEEAVQVTILNERPDLVSVYVMDDTERHLNLSIGSGQVKVVSHLSSLVDTFSDKNMVYYQIDITVSHGGKPLANISSYRAEYVAID